jgi:hypothetical protein
MLVAMLYIIAFQNNTTLFSLQSPIIWQIVLKSTYVFSCSKPVQSSDTNFISEITSDLL